MARDTGIDMGFIAIGPCSRCKSSTFAKDGVCASCRQEEEQEGLRETARRIRLDNGIGPLGLDCE